jgi:hypothetical protein
MRKASREMPSRKVAFDRFAGSVGDRMHQAFEAVPVLGESGEEGVDIGVFGNVAAIEQGAVELRGELGDARFEAFVLVGEGQLRAFAVAGFGDAIGDRVLRQYAGDQNSLVGEESHDFSRN